MVSEMVRAHVVIPRELLEEIDSRVGQRRRSDFVTEALREKLMRERQREALRVSAGVLDLADYPQWETPEKVSAWVREQREQDTKSLLRKWGGQLPE
ncbi:MAG: CopG family ribbon-helix-helix protein [Dehalococcoidia bacterium]